MRHHHPLTIVWGYLALLVLLAGSGAAGAYDAPLSPRAAWPRAAAALDVGVDLAPLAQDACAPQAGSWVIERPDAPKDLAAQGSRTLALDGDGHPHIAYGGDRLYYAWHDGTTWHREVADPALGVGIYASLVLDTAGRPHISYYDDILNDLKYAHFDGAQWNIHTVDPTLSDS